MRWSDVINTVLPDRGKLGYLSLVAVSGGVCLSRETDDEVFTIRNLNVMPKTTEQHLMRGLFAKVKRQTTQHNKNNT